MEEVSLQRIRSQAGHNWIVRSRFEVNHMGFKLNFTRKHLLILAGFIIVFALLSLMIVAVGANSSGEGRGTKIILTTLLSPSGPLAGAFARDGQDCCTKFSLGLLPYCGAFLLVGVGSLVSKAASVPGRIRMFLWCVGLTGWFLGVPVSLMHALS